jgi:hypothetical protein
MGLLAVGLSMMPIAARADVAALLADLDVPSQIVAVALSVRLAALAAAFLPCLSVISG